MTLSNWLGFVLTVLVAVAVPGPDFVVVVQAAGRGWRTGVRTVAGVMTGLCVHAGLATAGLAALLAALPGVLDVLRLVGAGVLIWLAVKMINSARSMTRGAGSIVQAEHPFRRGFVVDVSNPKAPIFFGAVLPQFVGHGPVIMNTAILGLTVVGVCGSFWLVVVLAARSVRIGRSPTGARVVATIGGVLLAVVAVLLAAPTLDHLLRRAI